MGKNYYSFSDYFKNLGYKTRVQKITVDAGFSCPNRDGSLSDKGCIFCNNESFSPNLKTGADISGQIETSIKKLKVRYKTDKFMVYFQPFTNTYADVSELKPVYETIKKYKEVMGISIGTRPDCLDNEKLELINSYAANYDTWLELGLQSSHNTTLKAINRGHSYEDFTKTFEEIRKYPGIKICVHVILGLPGETDEMMLETARRLGKLKPDGIKIHPLHAVKNTGLEKMYLAGGIKLPDLKEYAAQLVSFLELLPASVVVQRFTADCPENLLVAPSWINDKNGLLKQVEAEFEKRKTRQGRLFEKD